MPDWTSTLRGITTLLYAEADRTRYAVDGMIPHLVALPATEAEAAACLQVASLHGLSVAPRGGGTKGALGNTLARLDLVLTTERLTQVVEYVPEDLTVTVQAGMRFADLQALVKQHGQMLPLDPPHADHATIGGIVATNSAGPQRLAYGTVRDSLIGTRLALADGRLIKTGGRVVKNVAGYDMNKLIAGSLGSLGVITEVSFKLRPLPAVTQTLRFGFADLDQALAAAEAILNTELLPTAVVALTPGPAARLEAPGPVALAVSLAESPSNIAYQAERLQVLGAGARAQDLLTGPDEERFWEGVRNYGELAGAPCQMRINTVIADVGPQFAAAATADGIAYVGSGTVLLFAETLDLAGTKNAVLEKAPPEVKRQINVWGAPRPEWALMRGIKRALDPAGILNPGRFIFTDEGGRQA